MKKELGKISRVHFGHGGYQDAQIGLFLTLEGTGWGVQTQFSGGWSMMIKHSPGCKWTEEGRVKNCGEMVLRISELLIKAKVDDVAELVGVPVEATFDDSRKLESFRILEEVL